MPARGYVAAHYPANRLGPVPVDVALMRPGPRHLPLAAPLATNLRQQPQAGAKVLRTLPRGLELQLYGRAPGGWLQVGDAEPWGWVHSSLTATP